MAAVNFWTYPITSKYGKRTAPTKGASTDHKGTDYATPTGTAIGANVAGEVTYSGYNSGFGNYITIKDSNGYTHYYAHLSRRNVETGDKVNIDDVLGYSGSSGISTGPHLHYEVHDNTGKAIDSNKYIIDSKTNLVIDNENDNADKEQEYKWYNKEFWLNIVGNVMKYIAIIAAVILLGFFIMKTLDIDIKKLF